MFQISTLPRITFVSSDGEETLELSGCGAQIQHLAGSIRELTAAQSTVGLLFSSGPKLVIAWLSVLAAGRVPLILQYPNEKSSKSYWRDSVRDTVDRAQVGTLLCGVELASTMVGDWPPCLLLDELEAAEGGDGLEFPVEGHILQLSSGTTGYKKPISFSFDSLRSHAELYNQSLELTKRDGVVSWLPLYHDMGFIACFVMPLMLGVPIVMMDPMIWVKQPGLLYEAIERHDGTICYMPNFGFEVMAKLGKSGPFRTMRRWVSCSEPTHLPTMEKFREATGSDPATLSNCYGMAENVFAVAQSDGLRMFERDGKSYLSCGKPIAGTMVKEVDGELFVRSPHSLVRYAGGEDIGADIRDEEGFYATGDMGFLVDGEIIVTGRKQDLAIIGGRKYLLNDWDYALGKVFSLSAGRIASLATFDGASGTEKAIFLIEASNFWEWNKAPEANSMVREATGVEWMEVHFVPPQFITKTSSGKINRKRTLADWQACQADRVRSGERGETDFAKELTEQFPGVPFDAPVQECLDSLGELILRMLCEERGIEYTPELSLAEICAASKESRTSVATEVFSIVALMDGQRLGPGASGRPIDEAFLRAIEAAVGVPVHFEHIAAPPAPVLFSDLVFHDYFMARDADGAYDAVSAVLAKIKNASLILVDDEDNFRLPPFCSYPVLSHTFTKNPEAEMLGHRLQRYTQSHHLLARDVLRGREVAPQNINATLKNLEAYLNVPLMKMAFHEPFRAYTQDWDFCAYSNVVADVERGGDHRWVEPFKAALLQFLGRRGKECKRRVGEPKNRFVLVDTPHFCSFLLNRKAVDYVTSRYASFCIVGLPSSLPYLQKRLDALGKPYFFSSQVIPRRKDYACLILTGGVGGKLPLTDKPTFDFVHARADGEGGGRPHNVPAAIVDACPPLAACDEGLYRSVLPKYGVLIGNFLLNTAS